MTDLDTRPILPNTPVTAPRRAERPGLIERARSSPWAPMPVLVAAVALIVIDFFIVNVAVPSMQSHLHTSAGAIEWVVAGYGLSFAVLLVTAGRLGDRYGHRGVLSTGMALFIAASTACGLAPDPAVLIAGRLVQGAAAALISPSVLSLIGVLYTGQARVKAIAIYGTSLGVAAAAGQLIGGALIQADIAGAGWRAVFLINVPVGLIALALTRPLVAESRATTAHRVDVLMVTGELFEQDYGEIIAFVPVVGGPAPAVGGDRVVAYEVPAAELAVTMHRGEFDELDRTYGALGTFVAERELGVEGPIREYYVTDSTRDGEIRIEVGWPIFRTRQGAGPLLRGA